MLLGVAYRGRGDEHSGTVELEGALATFEQLGAKLDEERAKQLPRNVCRRRAAPSSSRTSSTRRSSLPRSATRSGERLLARHDELVREAIVGAGGEVVKNTGDGFFASFDNPKAAIDAAVAIQRALGGRDRRSGREDRRAHGRRVPDRGGLGGLRRPGRARRRTVGAAATAGEILVSGETLDGVGSSFRLSEPRTEALKGFAQPVDVVSVDWR